MLPWVSWDYRVLSCPLPQTASRLSCFERKPWKVMLAVLKLVCKPPKSNTQSTKHRSEFREEATAGEDWRRPRSVASLVRPWCVRAVHTRHVRCMTGCSVSASRSWKVFYLSVTSPSAVEQVVRRCPRSASSTSTADSLDLLPFSSSHPTQWAYLLTHCPLYK